MLAVHFANLARELIKNGNEDCVRSDTNDRKSGC